MNARWRDWLALISNASRAHKKKKVVIWMKHFLALSLVGMLCFGMMGCRAEVPVIKQPTPTVTSRGTPSIPPSEASSKPEASSTPMPTPTPVQPQIPFSSTQLKNRTLTDADVVLDNKYVLSLGMSKRECLDILEKSGVEVTYNENSGKYEIHYRDSKVSDSIPDFLYFDKQNKLDLISLRKEYSANICTARGLDTSCAVGYISYLYGTEGLWSEVNQREAVVRTYYYEFSDSFLRIYADMNDLKGQHIYLIEISKTPLYDFNGESRDSGILFDAYGEYSTNMRPNLNGTYSVDLGASLEWYKNELVVDKVSLNIYDILDKNNELLCRVETNSSQEIIAIETKNKRASTLRGLLLGSSHEYMMIVYGTQYDTLKTQESQTVHRYELYESVLEVTTNLDYEIQCFKLSIK